MEEGNPSSLERFVQGRGMQLSGRNYYGQKAFGIQFSIGAVLSLVGVGMAAASLLGAQRELIFAAIGPFTAGAVNVGVALGMRKKSASSQAPTVNLTPEAKRLLSALVWKFVWKKNRWYMGEEMWGAGSENWHGCGWQHYLERPLNEITADAYDYLEQAAFQYNRVQASLATAHPGTALDKMRSRIVAAADEGIADALHQAALISKYPEGSEAVRARLSSSLTVLTELGARVEALNVAEPTFLERMSVRSN
ncbi:MAG TPA: hypothetical protein VG944_14415, partial [Fimbriimonas sp.]|nr:hypothetical protein [Fimbriimonas sp.]